MRILIVEDYAPIREAVAQSLSEEGFAVDATGDGKEGLWYATTNPYDAIILDLNLPGLPGLELLRQARAKGVTSHVLVLTARDGVDDRVRGLDAGADDYLIKPFAMPELLSRIRALVRRGYGRKNPEIRIADLRIDTASHEVKRGGKPVDLTAREFALLEYMAMRAGQVVTRTEIWEHVYDFHSEAGSNVVDVYIGYLRKKLHGKGQAALIHTRRGQGYVLGEAT
ncbi:MAG: response regulator transcription factor [Planctomycetes bacterium]|nr:response regulator transcription factor [Planctomycetota bacterium]